MFNRKFAGILFLLIFFNQSIHSKEKNCQNYPYKEGFSIQKKLGKFHKYIYTSTNIINTFQSKKIDYIKLRADSYTKFLLKNSIELKDKDKKYNKNPFYKLFSCTSVKNGIYKVSYAQIQELNLFQRLKIFFFNNHLKP